MKAMLLAAGLGTRMGELTAGLPKPLLRIGNESLIERHLRRLKLAGIDEVVINLSYRGEQIRESLGNGVRFGLAIEYSVEGEPPLETAGGIINALPLLGDDPFLVINADIVCDIDFGALQLTRGLGRLVLVPNPAHNPGGDFGIDDDGRATLESPLLTFSGISVLQAGLFAAYPPGRRALKPILDVAIGQRALYACRYDGYWLDVGTPERLEAANTLIVGGEFS